ncbi:MAG: hypothetical protein HYR86_11055, partial [Candidatus Rokubacteria bacterium]|nr:hypothetical protein [Candidatus Rokubacteria bacterium]
MADARSRWLARLVPVLAVLALWPVAPAAAAVKPRPVLVVPFDTTPLGADEKWIGEAIAQTVSLGLAQHPAFVQYERGRVRPATPWDVWTEAAVVQTGRSLRAEAAIFGQVTRAGTDLTILPRLLELKPSGPDVIVMEPVAVPEGELINRLAALPPAYARTMKVALTDAESARMDKAARSTRSLRALELYARSEIAARRGGQEGLETADGVGRVPAVEVMISTGYIRDCVINPD